MKTFKWGTYGIDGNGELVYKNIEELTSEHLLNILITETWHMHYKHIVIISNILRERGIKFKEGELTNG